MTCLKFLLISGPLVGKYLSIWGVKAIFPAGFIIDGGTFILFRMLQWVNDTTMFLYLIRFLEVSTMCEIDLYLRFCARSGLLLLNCGFCKQSKFNTKDCNNVKNHQLLKYKGNLMIQIFPKTVKFVWEQLELSNLFQKECNGHKLMPC